MANKPAKALKQVDLSEYAEEAIPFDAVIRQIMKAKPVHRVAANPAPKKRATKRK
jgi:hypothetical protein